jgi:hypothetical protein
MGIKVVEVKGHMVEVGLGRKVERIRGRTEESPCHYQQRVVHWLLQ